MNRSVFRDSKLRIIILGYIIRGPIGGLTWHHLQYVKGLVDLGHEVYFLEDSDDYESCYDPSQHKMTTDPGYGLQYARKVFKRIGMSEIWCYYDAHTSKWHGPCAEKITDICAHADLLLNISAVNPLRQWLLHIPVRVLIDTDPAFIQIRHLLDEKKYRAAKLHTAFFSFGENLLGGECKIPDDGFTWKPTRQPIVLNEWQPTQGPESGRFTTVMQWTSYPAVQYEGMRYGMKSEMFEEYMDLPTQTKQPLELALGSDSAPKALLLQKGWKIKDPLKITKDPWTYQRYIRRSKAEFSIAKHGYVVSNSGWFSERSAAYLASGRPVLVQDTGFRPHLETGKGLLSFRSTEEALEGIWKINMDYQMHCKQARKIAEQFFDSRKVLTSFLNQLS